jgi:iron complex outermembrane receptor protein
MVVESSSAKRADSCVASAVRGVLRGRSALAAASVVAMAVATPARAQQPASSVAAETSTGKLEQVIVTARRQALENAADRKKNAESIIDSIVADEAGMLPDNSMTEVLQRVTGVTIVRFGSLGDPDHFSAEGSGLQVRGLSGVAGRLNGREIFSANSGRALSWTDVTPELMAAVDVYKASTADLIEGGTGGQIDLRTKMPFDFSAGPQLQVSAGASYGDLAEEVTPGGSFLVSDRWDTRFGEFGALVDVAYSKFEQNADFFRMEPYYRTNIGGQDRFIPGGYDYGDESFERTRKGLYVGLQWAPTENLTLSQTIFYSEYEDERFGSGLFVVSKDLAVDPAGNNVFDASGGLLSSDSVFLRDPNTFNLNNGQIFAGGNTGISQGTSETRDITTSFRWTPSDRWAVKGALQVVDSSATRDNYDVFPGVPFPGRFGLDLTGDLPLVIVPDAAATSFADPAQYEWQATMDHMERNDGDLRAGNIDVEYTISEEGFFRSAQVGARYAERTERDNNSGYNWTALGRGWNGSPQMHFSDSRAGDVESRTFDNFFRGETRLPGNTLMPSFQMVSRYDVVGDHTFYGGMPVRPIQFGPFDHLEQETINTAGYALVRFGGERGLFGIPYDGNVGVRVVRIENESRGFFKQSPAVFLRDGVPTQIAELGQERTGGRTLTRGLPSLNFRLLPSDAVRVRLAYNITLDQPSFQALRTAGEAGVRTVSPGGGGVPNFDGFTTNTGNPNLLPVISHNSDLSVEWYPSRATTAHMSLFHKSIDNWIAYGNTLQPIPITYTFPTQQTVVELASTDNVFNSTKTATVKGVEIGARTFFERLPAPWDGLGIDANYTYIDSKNPGDRYLDIDGIAHTDAPVQGLSENNFNVQLMYEKGPVSLRLAYSWRSEYLMSTASNGTSGDYTYRAVPGDGTLVDISLPVYADDYGQLDFGSSFRPNDHLSFSLDLSNLTDEVTRTLQGGYPGGKYVRSWFISDRRIDFTMRYNF